MTTINLQLLLERMCESMAETPVYVVICRRDEYGSTTHKAKVPIARLSPDLDGGGFKICIEESKIKFKEFR